MHKCADDQVTFAGPTCRPAWDSFMSILPRLENPFLAKPRICHIIL